MVVDALHQDDAEKEPSSGSQLKVAVVRVSKRRGSDLSGRRH